MQIRAESGKSALPICNYSQILYQFLTFTQNLKRSQRFIAFFVSSNLIILRHSLLHLRDQTSQSPCLHYADHPYDRRSLKACYISQVDLSLRG